MTSTYSEIVLSPYILTQDPILQFHDIILFSMKVDVPILEFFIIVQFLSLTPSEIEQPSPITTFGPILQLSPILAV